jgi:outer membrane protein assembly factor BamB
VQADQNGDGKFDFEEKFYRTNSNVAIKDNVLVVADFSGLVRCLNAKTGHVNWFYDSLAASYASPLIVGDKVYVADEDGDVAIFGLSDDPKIAMADGNAPLGEINMGNSKNCGSSD